MRIQGIPGVPDFDEESFVPKSSRWCLLIPVINEDGRLQSELARAQAAGVDRLADIVLCDGGSTDGSTEPGRLASLGVNTLLIKRGPGRQGAQLRTGIYFALARGYDGVLTIDGNNFTVTAKPISDGHGVATLILERSRAS